MSRPSRPSLLRSSVLGLAVAVVVPVLVVTPTARAEDPPAAGETVVGELVQGYADPAPQEHLEDGHADEDALLSWVQTAPGEAVRVPTADVADIEVGATVEVTLGDPVVDEAAQEGLEPAQEVLAAEVLAAPDAPAVAPATTPVNHPVTVVMLQPAGSSRDATTLAQVMEAVNGPVADFWAEQTGGAVRLGTVAPGHDWTTQSARTCNDPFALWQEAATRAGWSPGPGKHLLVYVPSGSPGCAYGLGTIGTGLGSGGMAYVQAKALSVIAHEFGHNLGLGHSSLRQCDRIVVGGPCRISSYDDMYDVMGISWGPVGSLNAPQAAVLGVLPRDTPTLPAGAGTTLYTLSPVGARTGTRAIRLTDSDGVVYWLEYRTPTGRDGWLGTTANWPRLQSGVLLRESTDVLGDTSWLLDGTPSGQDQWSSDLAVALPGDDPVTFGRAPFTVDVLGVTPTGAQVQVSGGMPTGAGTPHLQAAHELSGDQSLVSPSGAYRAVAQTDGNFVVYARDRRVLWASGVQAPGARTTLQSDGNLVTYVDSRPVWDSRTWGNPGARLAMQDDGNLVLYRANGSAAWWTGWDTPDRLRPGQQLVADQALTSPNRRYRAVAQTDGNLVVYAADGRVLWASNVHQPGARLVLQTDGNLVGYAPSGRPVWDSRTWGNAGTRLVMQDDGNLVLYRANGSAAWSTGWDTPDRLRPGQQLFAGQALVAPSGRYRAVAQTDGNLVVYSAGGRVVWASSRYATGARLVMQGDGNLVGYARDGRAIWSTNTWRFPGATAVLRDDGSLAVHHNGRAIWASPVDGQR